MLRRRQGRRPNRRGAVLLDAFSKAGSAPCSIRFYSACAKAGGPSRTRHRFRRINDRFHFSPAPPSTHGGPAILASFRGVTAGDTAGGAAGEGGAGGRLLADLLGAPRYYFARTGASAGGGRHGRQAGRLQHHPAPRAWAR